MQGHDPRFGQPPQYTPPPSGQGYGQQGYGQQGSAQPSAAQPGLGQPASGQPLTYGHATGPAQAYAPPQAYGQVPGASPVQAYGQGASPVQAYGPGASPVQAYGPGASPVQAYGQPHSYPPPSPAAAPAPGGWQAQMAARAGNLNLPGGLGKAGQISGLPAPVAFGLGLVAVLVALVFDVIFLKVHIPGVGSYAWYLTTALSFAGAGWASIKWTRASKTVATTALGFAAALYGLADLGLGLVVEDLSLVGAIMLGAQGVAIGVFCGFGGVFKAIRERDE
jgi:hypothetical protein